MFGIPNDVVKRTSDFYADLMKKSLGQWVEATQPRRNGGAAGTPDDHVSDVARALVEPYTSCLMAASNVAERLVDLQIRALAADSADEVLATPQRFQTAMLETMRQSLNWQFEAMLRMRFGTERVLRCFMQPVGMAAALNPAAVSAKALRV